MPMNTYTNCEAPRKYHLASELNQSPHYDNPNAQRVQVNFDGKIYMSKGEQTRRRQAVEPQSKIAITLTGIGAMERRLCILKNGGSNEIGTYWSTHMFFLDQNGT
jgi:hypothetical protein